MLPDRSRALLTAYVDGELTPRQRRLVAQLLQDSAEARDLLQRLQDDASRLRGLTVPPLDNDLSVPVLNAIRLRRLRRARQGSVWPVAVTFPARAILVAAASVLLLVGMSSFFFSGVPKPGDSNPDDSNAGQGRGVAVAPTVDSRKTVEPRGKESPSSVPIDQSPQVAKKIEVDDAVSTPQPPEMPGEREAVHDEAPVTAPSMELFQPERAETVALPLVFPVHDWSHGNRREQLLGELRKESAFRIELPCRNATRAFGTLQAALRTLDIGIVVEQTALLRLRQPQWKTNYVVFAEDITPEDIAVLIPEIDRLDRKDKPAELQFRDLVVTQLTKGHRKELSDLLGVDPVPLDPRLTGPTGIDPHKSLPDVTAGQIANALSNGAGQGAGSRGSAVKPPGRQALAMPFNPVRPRRGSPDLHHFLDTRKPARPGTLQILIVLRGI